MINSPEIAPEVGKKIESKKKRREVIETKIENSAPERREQLESSFSEAKLAKIIEGTQVDLNNLKNDHVFKTLSPSQKAVALFHILSKNLNDLLKIYIDLINTDLRHAKKYEEEIKTIRTKQKILLKKIMGELEESEDLEKHTADLEELFS